MEAIILTKDQFDLLSSKMDEINTKISNITVENKNKFIDNQEFVMLMKISKRTAQSWRDEGKISYSQVGSKIYYKLADVQKLLEEHYNKAFKKRR